MKTIKIIIAEGGITKGPVERMASFARLAGITLGIMMLGGCATTFTAKDSRDCEYETTFMEHSSLEFPYRIPSIGEYSITSSGDPTRVIIFR
jgi:hypothetical protein